MTTLARLTTIAALLVASGTAQADGLIAANDTPPAVVEEKPQRTARQQVTRDTLYIVGGIVVAMALVNAVNEATE